MNINKELEDYKNLGKEFTLENINKKRIDIQKEIDDLDKKTHLITVLSFLEEFKTLLDMHKFSNLNISFMELVNENDYDHQNLVKLHLYKKDKVLSLFKDNELSSIGWGLDDTDEDAEFYDVITNLLSSINFNTYTDENFKYQDKKLFSIDENLITNLQNLFLSNELKISLNHALLDSELQEKNQPLQK